MDYDSFFVVSKLFLGLTREHTGIELVELRGVLVCPVGEPWNATNEMKRVMEGIDNLLAIELTGEGKTGDWGG